MPKMSDTMTEGVIALWLKKVGDEVKAGDILAEVETDKATMELEAYEDGTLLDTYYKGRQKPKAHIVIDKGQVGGYAAVGFERCKEGFKMHIVGHVTRYFFNCGFAINLNVIIASQMKL